MSKYVLGVDGGGTKTDAALATVDGTIVGLASGSGANWESVGPEEAVRVITDVITQACASANVLPSEVSASTLAIAGIDWPDDVNHYTTVIETLNLQNAALVNDSFAALAAGSPNGEGVISIAGTGGKTSGIKGNNCIQSMGMELGEGGGAGQLVSEALAYIAAQMHGSVSHSQLFDYLPKHYGFSDPIAFFEAVARKGLRVNTSLAPVIFELAEAKDPGAVAAITATALQHARDVIGISSKLNFGDEAFVVVRAGGLHTAGSALFDSTFADKVLEKLSKAEIRTLMQPPVIGAVTLSINSLKGML